MKKRFVTLFIMCRSLKRKSSYNGQLLAGSGWQRRWARSGYEANPGRFQLTAGRFYGDAARDKGLQTSENAKFCAISSRFKPFSNKGKADHSAYCESFFSSDLDQKNLSGDSHYYIMFGPDICGSETKKVHFKCLKIVLAFFKTQVDRYTHLYTLILRPDQTYKVNIDNEMVASGKLEDDLEFLPLRKINDPTVRKPIDWDDQMQIDDPNDIKPEVFCCPCLAAGKSEDWDDAVNGEWHYPMVKNPLYRV
uniref:Calreticulin 3 n=1 Tax=Athene cunicularia TaxID=194338 RepID=A0A663N0D3_ATHCN